MKTVLVGGCFDILHFGHITFLTEAKKHGDHLTVALESDETGRKMKGASRPIHTQQERKTMLEALSCVDEVLLLPPMNGDSDYMNLVMKYKPNVIAATDGDPSSDKKQKQALAVSAEFVVIPKIHSPSTSQLAKLLDLE